MAFPLTIIAAVFLAASTIGEDTSYITVESEPQTVTEGEHFFINVYATAHTPINAVDIVIDYPETQMTVTGVDVGESVITLWTEDPYAKDGQIHLRGGVFQKGFLGEHLIARVRAVADQSGVAHMDTSEVTFIAGDGEGTEVAVTDLGFDDTRVYIANEDGSLVGTASVKIITDVDGDGKVDLKDVSAFMAAWFNKDTVFDFNGDGRMTFRDFSILLADSFFK